MQGVSEGLRSKLFEMLFKQPCKNKYICLAGLTNIFIFTKFLDEFFTNS